MLLEPNTKGTRSYPVSRGSSGTFFNLQEPVQTFGCPEVVLGFWGVLLLVIDFKVSAGCSVILVGVLKVQRSSRVVQSGSAVGSTQVL